MRKLPSLLTAAILVLIVTAIATDIGPWPDDPTEYHAWKREYVESTRPAIIAGGPLRREMIINCENGYVIADMDEESGIYDQGADPSGGGTYFQISFSWPLTFGSSTSWVMYKVDALAAEGTDRAPAMPAPDDFETYSDGSIAVHWYNYHGVNITQKLTAVSLGYVPGENEQIKFEAFITSADGDLHNVGCMRFVDTDLRTDDGADISTSYGYTGTAEIFYAPSIPAFWRAYEGGYPPSSTSIQALGILWGFEAVMPDVFWYGQWGSGVSNGWDDSEWAGITGGTFGDSATMVKWYQRPVAGSGDTLYFCTYYGIGNLTATALYSTHIPPVIHANCDSLWPNPYNAEAIVVNGGTADADNVEARLIAPAGVTVVSTNPVEMGALLGYGASEFVYWDVQLDPSVFGTDITYTIEITYNEAGYPDSLLYVTNEFTISIPPGPYDIDVSADDSSFCAGESTNVYVGFPDMGSSFYAIHWFPPEPVEDPFARETVIYPETTSVIYCIVEDDLGCVHTDSVIITIFDPPAPAVPTMPPDSSITNPIGVNDLYWHVSGGTGPITYSVFYDDGTGEVELVANLSDTTYPLDALCSTIYDWYVIATNDCGSTRGPHSTFGIIPCGNPIAHSVLPDEGSWTSCSDQYISVFIEDSFEVDPTSFVIEVNDIEYSWPDPNLASSATGDTLYFDPVDDIFTHDMRVEYTVLEARNIYGVNINPISSYFFVDLMPPVISNQEPSPGEMVLSTNTEISFNIEDTDLPVDPASIVLNIDGYGSFAVEDDGVSWDDPVLRFSPSVQSIQFPAGDTIYIDVDAADLPDLCYGNLGNTSWTLVIQPTTVCHSAPNPFTPNNDGTNDEIVFGFPFMFSDGAKLQVFSKRHELVYEADLSNIDRYEDYAERSWNGLDGSGNKLPPGLYLYIITQKGEVICNGSITLVR